MHTNSTIELSLSALKKNLSFLKRTFGREVRISSVVKGNAYGHGIREFVRMASRCGIDHFSVFDSNEARKVREVAGKNTEIMIMGFVENESLAWAVANDVSFFVFEKDRLQKAVRVAKKLGKKACIHVEVETGMNRTGFDLREIPGVIRYIQKEKDHLQLKGLCTHYAGAESVANYYRVTEQIKVFKKVHSLFIKEGLRPEIRHTACSAAAMVYPETRMDMVRIGIMQYGLWPSPETFVSLLNRRKAKTDPLRRVIAWKSKVMSIKKIRAGDFIGYGTHFMAKQKMKIAVVPIGYSHGYSRSLSNQGRVLIHGHRCVVVGSVGMNMMIVDVSVITDLKKGDEVVMIGAQEQDDMTVASFSDYSDQLNYELLARLSRDIPRKIVD
ncbi:alanine racemase [Sinomicrobium weinanense]|uniref:Alanine racemase n=1 Tax=Sinomicrobium weinanense TaxID=2842200 RepID=A0A926Q252_9FLAO|nr:alanine racemase [Sinomicrobium weinanense]MBC9796297.1 alanine racemase [Sinomicrobium weinanense]MBU3123222.1 alanine racemase [Sinomicrobium weinanense]